VLVKDAIREQALNGNMQKEEKPIEVMVK